MQGKSLILIEQPSSYSVARLDWTCLLAVLFDTILADALCAVAQLDDLAIL
jgi:hypothetical protein